MMDLPNVSTIRRARRWLRPWILASCVWWAYLAWGYWSYRLPDLDPKPMEVSGHIGPHISMFDDMLTDDYSPESIAYYSRLQAYENRRQVRAKLFWFSLPISMPLGLWITAAIGAFLISWASEKPKERQNAD